MPQATIDLLKRRNGKARIYLFGGPSQISGSVASQLAQYGTVVRVTNDDNVAFNKFTAGSQSGTTRSPENVGTICGAEIVSRTRQSRCGQD